MDDSQAEHEASGHEEGPEPTSSSGYPIRRACDACRSRKIRCNRESPCSHCLHAKIECTHADNKPKEKRTRVLITPQYERKIDLIDRRLDGVIRLLEDLKTSLPSSTVQVQQPPSISFNSSPAQPATKPASSTSTPSANTSQSHQEVKGSLVEGNSSLSAQSVFANEFLQKVVSTGSLQDASLEMRDTLDSLSHIVNALKSQTFSSEMSYPHARPLPRPSLKSSALPPIEKSVTIMRQSKSPGQSLASMAWIYEFLPMQRFPDLTLNVYFSDDYSEYDFITVNAGLYSLFFDYTTLNATREEKAEYQSYCDICRDNLETALSNLPLHIPATESAIVSLVFGAFYAIEVSKPSLSWTLACKASELSQTMGYHRAASLKGDSSEVRRHKQFLFWSIYLVEKSLSLRLGRASTLPDWDINIPPPSHDEHDQDPFIVYFSLWIEAGRCQGQIYEQLYSPDSLVQPDSVREARVRDLVIELESLGIKTIEVNRRWEKLAKDAVGESLMDFFVVSDDVLRLSLLTLVYRAAPRPVSSRTTFSDDCIRTARATLARHQDCMEVLEKSGSIFFPTYVHWTLLFSPFIPFIVIFCQVIETQDQTDLARLHQFITSIQSAPTLSEAAAKMHRLFQVLYSVALRYVEFRITTPPADQTQASAEMDAYLAALGFPSSSLGDPQHQAHQQQQTPQPADFGGSSSNTGFGQSRGGVGGVLGDSMDTQRTGNPMIWMGNGAQLEDWFYSNQQMMGLLQEPSFTFPPNQN